MSKSKHPKIYLVLSALMVCVALIAYVFEEELFDVFYEEYTFLLIITGAVLFALFFLYAYRFPRIGLPLLGRSIELDERRPAEKSVKVEFMNMVESATDHKRRMSRVKNARQMRKKVARTTRAMKNDEEKP